MSAHTVISHAQIQGVTPAYGEPCRGDRWQRGCRGGLNGAPRTVVTSYDGVGYCKRHSPLDVDDRGNPVTWAYVEGRGYVATPVGVSLAKAGDPVRGNVELCAPYGDGTAPPMRVNLARTACDWCEGDVPAFYTAVSVTAEGAWVERFCRHHALRYGRFAPVGFVETV